MKVKPSRPIKNQAAFYLRAAFEFYYNNCGIYTQIEEMEISEDEVVLSISNYTEILGKECSELLDVQIIAKRKYVGFQFDGDKNSGIYKTVEDLEEALKKQKVKSCFI
ncbi:MAG: hypothetical protein WAS72_05950 [Saprospiraceae bacterium]